MNRVLFLLIVFVALGGAPVQAQSAYPRGEIFLGYSYRNMERQGFASRHDSHGWGVSLSANFHKNFGVTADFGGHYGSALFQVPGIIGVGFPGEGGTPLPPPILVPPVKGNFRTTELLFGPRITHRTGRFTAFAHALVGAVNTRTSPMAFSFNRAPGVSLTFAVPGASQTNLALGFGTGMDINVHKCIALRVVQLDYQVVRSLNDVRVQSGVVFRLGSS